MKTATLADFALVKQMVFWNRLYSKVLFAIAVSDESSVFLCETTVANHYWKLI
jgi:hypothetical protein